MCILSKTQICFISYGSGFIFTTALPPDKIYAALTSLEILKSEEGRNLRERHQANVRLLRTKLVQHGFPVEYTPSHIVPILVRGNKFYIPKLFLGSTISGGFTQFSCFNLYQGRYFLYCLTN